VSFEEVALGLFRIFLLIGPIDHLDYFFYETLESVAVLGPVLSLGVENADAIQEAFKFTQPGPVLLFASQSFHRVDGMIHFSFPSHLPFPRRPNTVNHFTITQPCSPRAPAFLDNSFETQSSRLGK
jgi:hypothetical protein